MRDVKGSEGEVNHAGNFSRSKRPRVSPWDRQLASRATT